MNAMHQYLLDSYRASQRGDRRPPQPGRHDWQVVRELGDYAHFRGRAGSRGRTGAAVARLARLLRLLGRG
ncbi:hypothetical protein ACIHCQ_32825 [Streptomyces sp. NPDC052236]|uniref:hypothetical protein n=1 Tax=Streptomyces sp. NPDC052236 TaxID=3365686 RepID=UPI0037D8699C